LPGEALNARQGRDEQPVQAFFDFVKSLGAARMAAMTVVEAERRRADALAHRKGFAAGQTQAQSEADQRIATAVGLIDDGLSRLDRALTGIETRLETEAVEVAVAVAAKLAPELIAREPFAEISALATECFRHLVTTPHVVVRVGADIYETAKDKLEEPARARLRGPAGGDVGCRHGARRLPHRMGRRRRQSRSGCDFIRHR
jgi:flagellar assembly protein FliH